MSGQVAVRFYYGQGRPTELRCVPEEYLGASFPFLWFGPLEDSPRGPRVTGTLAEFRIYPAGSTLEELWIAFPSSWLDDDAAREWGYCDSCGERRPGGWGVYDASGARLCGWCLWDAETRRIGSAGAAYDARRR